MIKEEIKHSFYVKVWNVEGASNVVWLLRLSIIQVRTHASKSKRLVGIFYFIKGSGSSVFKGE